MKIRIKGNTLRLRLTQTEIQHLADQGEVSETITFGPDQSLVYTLTRSTEVLQPTAAFANSRIHLVLPDEAALAWIGGDDEVSIFAELENSTSEKLSLLIEKDFRCLTERTSEDEADLFPHPKEGQVNC